MAGTAASYQSQGPLPANGEYHLVTGPSAAYKTRIVVRRPASAAAFNGTVVVEWLNVSGGLDAAPDYTYVASELVRGGYAWVGVSAQKIGVEGGAVAVNTPVSAQGGAGKGLRHLDPARYASLHHPGDAFSYDIFTQVAAHAPVAGQGRPARWPPHRSRAGHGRVAVGLRADDLRRRHPAAGAAVRRVPHPQPGRRRGPARQARPEHRHLEHPRRPAHQDPHRRQGTRAGAADRDRRGGHPRLLPGHPARQRHVPAVGGGGHRARRQVPARRHRGVLRLPGTRSTRAPTTSSPTPRCTSSPPGSTTARRRRTRRGST